MALRKILSPSFAILGSSAVSTSIRRVTAINPTARNGPG